MANPFRGGTPDSWYSGDAGDLWVEWKWLAKMPVRRGKVGLRPLQVLWLRREFEHGRTVRVVVGTPDGCVVLSTPDSWEKGIERDKAQVLTKEQVADWIRSICVPKSHRQGSVRG